MGKPPVKPAGTVAAAAAARDNIDALAAESLAMTVRQCDNDIVDCLVTTTTTNSDNSDGNNN